MRIRAIASAIALVLVVAATAACGSSDSAATAKPEKIRIAFQKIPNGDLIVKNKGWLEEATGVAVEWQEFASGADVNRAVASGSVDFGLAGSNPVTIGAATGLPYACIWIFDVIGEAESLIVRGDSGITSVSDLKGRKIATPFGSTAHYSLLSAVVKSGLKATDVSMLDMAPQDALAAWQRGDIDGAYLWNPVLGEMKKAGGKVITSSAELAKQGVVTSDLGVVSTAFATKYPDIVRTWVAQQDRAVTLYREDASAASDAVAAELGITKAEAQDQMSQLVWLSAAEQSGAGYLGTKGAPGKLVDIMAATAVFLKDQGKITAIPSRETIAAAVDGQYLK